VRETIKSLKKKNIHLDLSVASLILSWMIPTWSALVFDSHGNFLTFDASLWFLPQVYSMQTVLG
jgi:hypothetical protein